MLSRRPPAATARLLLSLGAVLVLGSACSSEEPDPPAQSAPSTSAQPDASTAPSVAAAPSEAAPSAAASAAEITIAGFDYAVPDSVPAGSEISVTNEDRQAHTFTVEGTEESLTVAGGETMTMAAPAAPGTYRITCDFHGDMTAELVVT